MCLTQPGQSCFDSKSPLDGLLDLGCATTKCIQSSGIESRTKDRPAQKSHFLAGCASWAKKGNLRLVVVVEGEIQSDGEGGFGAKKRGITCSDFDSSP